MTKEKLFKRIEAIMNNNLDELTLLHEQFKPLILKYSKFLSVDFKELNSELDFIIVKIYNAKIEDDYKILKYIKIAFKNYKKKKCIAYGNIVETGINNVEKGDFFFYDLIKDCNEKTKNILELKFMKQYNNSEIAKELGVTRQYIHKKIKKTLEKLKEEV